MSLRFNKRALNLAKYLTEKEGQFGVKHEILSNGSKLIDCGVYAPGSFEAGIIVANISVGGYANIALERRAVSKKVLYYTIMSLAKPGITALCIQGAFPIFPDQKSLFYISGPGRVLFRKPEEIYEFFGYEEEPEEAIFIIEDDEYPEPSFIERLSKESDYPPDRFTFILMPVPSKCGNVVISTKTIELVTLNLLLSFNWDVRKITLAKSEAPVMHIFSEEQNTLNLSPDDFMFYGGSVTLYVDEIDEKLEKIAPKLVFENTPGFGKLFNEMIAEANGNIREIDGYPLIFSPAKLTIIENMTGRGITFGHDNIEYLFHLISQREKREK